MQVFKKEEALVNNQNMQTVTGYLKLGVPIEEINTILGTNIKKASYEQPKANNNGGAGSGN